MRKPFICGNWKMNKTLEEARSFASELSHILKTLDGIEVAVCPPYTVLSEVGKIIDATPVQLGAQDVSWEKGGAFTGEISSLMLKDLRCSISIVGHSERRTLMAETDEVVNRKLLTALKFNLTPILCVGESLDQREAHETNAVVASQLAGSLAGVDQNTITEAVIAYEPIWAIGTGKTATPEMAQEVHAFIRNELSQKFGEAAAEVRILYGGSVNGKNAAALLAQTDIDGALVGGASLEVRSFMDIVEAARKKAERV